VRLRFFITSPPISSRCEQCSLEGLLPGSQDELPCDAAEKDESAPPLVQSAVEFDANADLIARLSACLNDDDPPPPPSPTTAGPSAPATLPCPPPVTALEPMPPPLTPAQLQTSSKIFSSWKAFSPYRMRSVIIPHQAIDAFMFAARANTARNVETCAILGGVQSGDSLVISTVIVPQQKGNRCDVCPFCVDACSLRVTSCSDYCEAAGEEVGSQ
jgi:hypothetical protein